LYRQIFGCESGILPFRYLGIPIHHRKLKNSDWNPVKLCFEGKLGWWQGKLLSYGDRLVLINSVLSSMPMFMLSFLEIPVGVGKHLIFIDHDSFGRVMIRRKNIVCPSGTLFAN
jgi:hypothetical protein